MKKTLVVLLILAVAGGVFAQEVTWSGIVESGVHIEKNKDEAGTVKIFNDNDGVTSRARIQGSYDAETYGLKVGVGSDFAGDGNASLYNAYGWGNFLDGMINVKSGLIDDGVWTTMGPEDFGVATGLGVRVEVTPIEGLNLGLFLNTGSDNYATVTAGQFLKETAFGASYKSDMFDVAAALKLDSDADGLLDADYEHTAIFGFVFKGVENLSVKVEGQITDLGKWSDYGRLWAIEDVSYQVMEPLNVGIRLDEWVFGNSDAKMALGAKPYVSYQVNEALSVGADLPFWYSDSNMSIGGTPWVKYAFSGNSWIKAFYALTYYAPDVGDSEVSHAIQLDFVYQF